MKENINKNITLREIDFAKWYTDIITQADLCDYGADIGATKGAIVFRPYSYAIWENIQFFVNKEFKKHKIQNLMMPMLITDQAFSKEKDHIAGFSPECAIVTKVGEKQLGENYIIRPTSEVLFCHHFQRIVKSYKQLPLLYNQWCNVIRWEKTTRPFLRNSEFLWQEGHTVHNNSEEAIEFAKKMINLYAEFVEKKLAIKVILGKKTAHERFAGALDTYTIETMMQDGQALQAGTSHYFGQKFANIFNIKFNNSNNQQEFVYQTSWGISTRLIGALIMAHSDDLGLVLPSNIAPIQLAILNLMPKNEEVNQFVKDIEKILNDSDITYLINDENKSAGFKKSETQIKGVPLMIEIGKNEAETRSLKLVIRHNLEVINFNLNEDKNLVVKIKETLEKIDQDLLSWSKKRFDDNLIEITDFNDYQKIITSHKGYIISPFCGEIECEKTIKEITNTNSRCVPLSKYKEESSCFKCKKENSPWTYFARSY